MRAIQCYFIQCYQKDREPKGPGQWNGPVSDMTVTFRGMRSLLRDCDGKFPSPNVNESTTFGSISSARLLEALRINVTFHLTSAQDARGEYDPLQKCHVERLRWFEVCVFNVFSHMVAINCPTFDTPKKKRRTWTVTCLFSTLTSDCRLAESEIGKTTCGRSFKLPQAVCKVSWT